MKYKVVRKAKVFENRVNNFIGITVLLLLLSIPVYAIFGEDSIQLKVTMYIVIITLVISAVYLIRLYCLLIKNK